MVDDCEDLVEAFEVGAGGKDFGKTSYLFFYFFVWYAKSFEEWAEPVGVFFEVVLIVSSVFVGFWGWYWVRREGVAHGVWFVLVPVFG